MTSFDWNLLKEAVFWVMAAGVVIAVAWMAVSNDRYKAGRYED